MILNLCSSYKKQYKLKGVEFIIFSYYMQAMSFGGCPPNYGALSFWTDWDIDGVKDVVDSLIKRGLLIRTVCDGNVVIVPNLQKIQYDANLEETEINPILLYMLDNFEDKRLSTNKTLKNKYIRQWTKSADELLNACEGDVELAKKMIKHYAGKQKEEWKLWDVTNNFCKIYDELKRAKKI